MTLPEVMVCYICGQAEHYPYIVNCGDKLVCRHPDHDSPRGYTALVKHLQHMRDDPGYAAYIPANVWAAEKIRLQQNPPKELIFSTNTFYGEPPTPEDDEDMPDVQDEDDIDDDLYDDEELDEPEEEPTPTPPTNFYTSSFTNTTAGVLNIEELNRVFRSTWRNVR